MVVLVINVIIYSFLWLHVGHFLSEIGTPVHVKLTRPVLLIVICHLQMLKPLLTSKICMRLSMLCFMLENSNCIINQFSLEISLGPKWQPIYNTYICWMICICQRHLPLKFMYSCSKSAMATVKDEIFLFRSLCLFSDNWKIRHWCLLRVTFVMMFIFLLSSYSITVNATTY